MSRMKERLKRLIKSTPLYRPLNNWMTRRRQTRELVEWERRGRGGNPPHLVKQDVLRKHAAQYNLRTLVETGTHFGDMVEAMKGSFDKIYSIELSQELFEQAKRRFRKDPRVELIHGDSGAELGKIMKRISQPTLFWLDGHYSGQETAKGQKETPICEELDHIFDAPDLGHVIIIDDARCFGSLASYPAIDELKKRILSRRKHARIAVEQDSIRITPSFRPNEG